MTLNLTAELSARRIGASIAQATKWSIETWTIAPTADPGASVAQVQLYKHKGVWYFWNGSCVGQKTHKLGQLLEAARRAQAD